MLHLSSGAMRAVLVVATICCLMAQGAILRTLRTVAAAPVAPDKRPSTLLETTWAVLPALVLVGILVTAWRQHLSFHPSGTGAASVVVAERR